MPGHPRNLRLEMPEPPLRLLECPHHASQPRARTAPASDNSEASEYTLDAVRRNRIHTSYSQGASSATRTLWKRSAPERPPPPPNRDGHEGRAKGPQRLIGRYRSLCLSRYWSPDTSARARSRAFPMVGSDFKRIRTLLRPFGVPEIQ